ncbi:hypothetical protein AAFF_G00368260 [Aldrovandia affinis]|uniref:Uncharacterized protein n=1 Tax=Aldrovandia affinis TaxID=143900 RepID=A0AAD7SHG3_9TELE|nr:hypothetical protein AAFF_G00368260 [Aldrovandia affinis]
MGLILLPARCCVFVSKQAWGNSGFSISGGDGTWKVLPKRRHPMYPCCAQPPYPPKPPGAPWPSMDTWRLSSLRRRGAGTKGYCAFPTSRARPRCQRPSTLIAGRLPYLAGVEFVS